MSYSKTTWKTGDKITAQLLNHAEDGIAANDAAIAAIPEGLQLYGPYFAMGSDTLTAGSSGNIDCATLEDANGISIAYPDATSSAVVMVSAVTLAGAVMVGFAGPGLTSGISGLEWADGIVTAYNSDEAQSSEVSATVTFYSTVEFPQES